MAKRQDRPVILQRWNEEEDVWKDVCECDSTRKGKKVAVGLSNTGLFRILLIGKPFSVKLEERTVAVIKDS